MAFQDCKLLLKSTTKLFLRAWESAAKTIPKRWYACFPLIFLLNAKIALRALNYACKLLTCISRLSLYWLWVLDCSDSQLGIAREAAYNLSLIYVVSGSAKVARDLYRDWLSF